MSIQTLAQARRAIALVCGMTLLAGGGVVFHVLKPEMSNPDRVLIIVAGALLIVAGLALLFRAAMGLTQAKRLLKIGIGFGLLILGLILALPGVPGPGFLVIIGALAILAVEFVWARKLLDRVKYLAARMNNSLSSTTPPNGSGSDEVH